MNPTQRVCGYDFQESPALLSVSLSELRAQIEREDIENAMKESKARTSVYDTCRETGFAHSSIDSQQTPLQTISTAESIGDKGVYVSASRACELMSARATNIPSLRAENRNNTSACMLKLVACDCRKRGCGSINTHPNPSWIF